MLLESSRGADVVIFGHVGLDGFEYISDIWSGGLVGTTVRLKFWRFPAARCRATATSWSLGSMTAGRSSTTGSARCAQLARLQWRSGLDCQRGPTASASRAGLGDPAEDRVAANVAIVAGVIFVFAGLVKFVFHGWELNAFRSVGLPWPSALELFAGVR